MDIPINAEVRCADGPCGRSTYVVIDPASRQITHVVVKEDGFPFAERLVPLDLRGNEIHAHAAVALQKSDGSLVAGGLDTQDRLVQGRL